MPSSQVLVAEDGYGQCDAQFVRFVRFLCELNHLLEAILMRLPCISDGFAYLSLLTDGYSRAIVGYALHPTRSSEGPLKALQMAQDFYRDRGIDTEGVIHHSDRGIQYASKEYTRILLDNHARISMTRTGDPLHNALAERMNNTVKNGWLCECERMDFGQTGREVDKAIYNYNWMRPH